MMTLSSGGTLKLLLALLLIPTLAFSQAPEIADLESGSTQGWPVSAVSLDYQLPEPVGSLSLDFRIEIESIAEAASPADTNRLVAGTMAFRDLGIIELPDELLKCLPFPQPSNASLVTVYIEPSSSSTHWVDEFTSYITIPFGRVSTVLIEDTEFSTYPTVEIAITGREIRRAAFANAAGEKRVLRDVVNACPRNYVDWASPPRSSMRQQIQDQFFEELSKLSD